MPYPSFEEQRKEKKRARERQLFKLRLRILLALFGLCLTACGFFIISKVNSSQKRLLPAGAANISTEAPSDFSTDSPDFSTDAPSSPSVSDVPPETPAADASQETELDSASKLAQIQSHPELYPSALLELVKKNEETIDFVFDYPEKSLLPPAETIGDKPAKGTIPLLLQWDERWGYAPYGTETIVALSGCGPTCIAMVASGLTQDNTITPAVVAEYAAANGYLDQNLNTSWLLMTAGCRQFGISGAMLGLDENAMANTLASGYPIICSMAPGIFTTTGHFIVLTGYENGAFTVNDPASSVRSSRTYTLDEFRDQIKNMWYFVPCTDVSA